MSSRWSASVSSEGSAPSRESSSRSSRNWRAAAGLSPLATLRRMSARWASSSAASSRSTSSQRPSERITASRRSRSRRARSESPLLVGLVGQQLAPVGGIVAALEALDVGASPRRPGRARPPRREARPRRDRRARGARSSRPCAGSDAAASGPSFGHSISSTSSRGIRWPGASASSLTRSVARRCAHASAGTGRESTSTSKRPSSRTSKPPHTSQPYGRLRSSPGSRNSLLRPAGHPRVIDPGCQGSRRGGSVDGRQTPVVVRPGVARGLGCPIPVVLEWAVSSSRTAPLSRLVSRTPGRSAQPDSGSSISRLRILPVGPLGSSSTNHTRRGYLYAAT